MAKTQNSFVPENIYIPHFGALEVLIGVEIGTGSACGSVAMLDRLPKLTLYCIDPWRHVELAPYEAGHSQEEHDACFVVAGNRLQPYGSRAIIIRKTSDEAINGIPNNVDFVHIDGHHEYSQVVKDINNYFPKIKVGGIISGHDYPQVPDVAWAVDEIFKDKTIHTGDDFTWWVYKDG